MLNTKEINYIMYIVNDYLLHHSTHIPTSIEWKYNNHKNKNEIYLELKYDNNCDYYIINTFDNIPANTISAYFISNFIKKQNDK